MSASDDHDLPPRFPARLLQSARSLEPVGIKQLAWDYPTVLEVIANIGASRYAILGGDVYRETNSELKPTYDNWACERKNGRIVLPWDSYVDLAKHRAVDYVEKYYSRHGNDYWFVLSSCNEEYFNTHLGRMDP